MKKKVKLNTKSMLIAAFFIAIILLFYNHITNNSSANKESKEKGEIELLCEYDMQEDYPKTAREVVKLHNRFFQVFYGQEVDDDELEVLNQQVRSLYSEELLSYNSENANLMRLKESIAAMKDKKITYKSFEIAEASQIKKYKQNGVDMASMEVTITVGKGNSIGYLYVQYVLVCEDDCWKIHAWADVSQNNSTDE